MRWRIHVKIAMSGMSIKSREPRMPMMVKNLLAPKLDNCRMIAVKVMSKLMSRSTFGCIVPPKKVIRLVSV